MITALKEQIDDGKTPYDAVVEVLGDVVAERAFHNDKKELSRVFTSSRQVINFNMSSDKLPKRNKLKRSMTDIHYNFKGKGEKLLYFESFIDAIQKLLMSDSNKSNPNRSENKMYEVESK